MAFEIHKGKICCILGTSGSGKSPLMNMMVKTEGDFDIQDGKYFVGNFQQGSNDYYSCTIIPMAIGTSSGKVIFEYEDALGEKHSIEKEFTFEAMEMIQNFEDPMDPYGEGDMIPFEEEEKSFPIVFLLIGLVLVIVVIVVLRKRSRKKKEMALDE